MYIEWLITTDEYTKKQLEQIVKITEKVEPEITNMLREAIKMDEYAKIEK